MTSPHDVLAEVPDLPRHEAERLLQRASGLTPAGLGACHHLSDEIVARFRSLVERRRRGVPLQHLEGTVLFGPLELSVDERALIPRPETEQLWEEAVTALGDAGPGTVIVDVCTGSGNLALALKHRFPAAQVYATDIDEDALALAEENAARLALEVSFLKGDLFQPLPPQLRGRVDLLVANPPYVAAAEYPSLPPEVRDHEPEGALVAGPSGDETLARLAEEAYWWLAVGGWAFVEIAPRQAGRALELFEGLEREVRSDLAGRPRILVARKGAPCCV